MEALCFGFPFIPNHGFEVKKKIHLGFHPYISYGASQDFMIQLYCQLKHQNNT